MNERSGRRRHVRTPLLSVVMIAVLLASGFAIYLGVHHHSTRTCRVVVHETHTLTYSLAPDQAENATTIAAVAKRLGLPDHAVTIGLAAAFQESQLHNLAHGDRDSLGLFQQRPSQGWGTEAQVMDPAYAADAFFTHLARVNNWETLPVTTAAQEVQRSGAPEAYAAWAEEAHVIARALTGEVPAGLVCPGSASHSEAVDRSLNSTMTNELGPVDLGATVSTARGWTMASWLVAHAQRFGISSVTFDGRRWTPESGTWKPSGPAVRQVQIEQRA